MKNLKEKAHAVYGPSSAERWTSCPASIKHCENAPPEKDSPYAKEGTDAHTCFEMFLKNGRAKVAATRKMLKGAYPTDMVEHALEAAEEIWRRTPPGAIVVAEQKVDISDFTDAEQFGTLDCAIVEEFGLLQIWDFKYGAGIPVDAEGNLQLILYALGAAKQYDYNFSQVELGVIQPRAEHHTGQSVRSWQIEMADLLEYRDFFLEAVKKTKAKNPKFVAGDHCRFCRGKVNCPEISKHAITQAQIAFDDETTEVVSVPAPETMAIKNLPQILEACEKLEKWIDAVRSHAHFVLEKGHKIDGFKLVAKRSTRKWADVSAAEKAGVKLFGPLVYAPKELLSPAQIEKALKEHYDPEAIKKFVAKNTTNVSSGYTLVPESDSRPAVNPAANAFDQLPEMEKPKKKGKK